MITYKEARELLRYEPHTGHFYWLKGRRPGQRAGRINGVTGYRQIKIGGRKGREYYEHRLAWLLMKGVWPREIDHINQIKYDNRWENLRECTRTQNNFNKLKTLSNTTGFKGISWNQSTKKWMARIRVNKKQVYLGVYDTKEAANEAYLKAAEQIHGEFFCPR